MIHKKHLVRCWPPSINIICIYVHNSCCYSFKKKKKNHDCRWQQCLSSNSMVPCKWLRSHQNPLNGYTWSFSLCDLIESPQALKVEFLPFLEMCPQPSFAPSKLNKTESVFRKNWQSVSCVIKTQKARSEKNKPVTQGKMTKIWSREPDVSRLI